MKFRHGHPQYTRPQMTEQWMSTDGQLGTKCRRNIAENFNRLSTAHERGALQTTDRRTGDSIYIEREHEFTFAKN